MDMLLHVGLANAVLATGLALAAWAVGRLARRPALAHALWLLVLLKLITPPLLTVPVSWPAIIQTASVEAAVDSFDEEVTEVTRPGQGEDFEPAQADLRPDESRADGPAPVTEAARQPATRALASVRAPWSSVWRSTLLAIWSAGALIFWSFTLLRMGWLRQLLRAAQPASNALQAQVRELADRLGVTHPPQVWLLPVPIPPMLWAVLGSPKLLLPADLWDRLSDEQRETLLAHELVHLRGRDHWVRRLELLALGLYWWHPVAWWTRRELREIEEQRCDAGVVQALPASAAAYAQTLLDTVAFLSRARCAAPLGASSMGQVRVLKGRLNMILQGTTLGTWSKRYWWIVLGLGALLLPLMPTWAQTQPRNVETPRVQRTEKGRDDVEQRLQDLEKKLDELRKEIAMLRRERGPGRAVEQPVSRRFGFIDLQPWANQKLDEDFHSGQYAGNNLTSLGTGRQMLEGVPFVIGKSLLQLGSRIDKPDQIQGIKVGRKLNKLHILHATGYSMDDDSQIAEYTVNYEDGTSVTIPVVYGKDVLDWWKYSFSGEPTRGKVVWNGENEPAKKEFDATIRLYMTTWENPKPDLRITSIDYSATKDIQCVPFCVAMTAEAK
jgi:beta-lactamase regulating signal transducer with metallopeptidase domain